MVRSHRTARRSSKSSNVHLWSEPLERRTLLSAAIVDQADFTGNGGQGGSPYGGLTVDSGNNLYGTTQSGGSYGEGTVFELAAGASTVTTVVSFSGNTPGSAGSTPEGDLYIDSSGNLYGTTNGGGDFNDGTIYEIPAGATTLNTLFSFDSTGGWAPEAGVAADSLGNLYGTTSTGGTASGGTLFEVVAGSQSVVTLANFDSTTGQFPDSQLHVDSNGNIFGTTIGGGQNGYGSLWELAANTSTISLLHSFAGSEADQALGDFAVDDSGDLFGVAQYGGANGNGSIYEWNVRSQTFSVLASIGTSGLQYPAGGLLIDADGNLWGTAQSNNGSLFELAAGATTVTDIVNFNHTDGEQPNWDLIADSGGNLFGTTYSGGADGQGDVFEITGSGFVPQGISLTAASNQTATANELIAFGFGTFNALGTSAPYSVDVNWGDGSADTVYTQNFAGILLPQLHDYTSAGSDTISFTVTDANNVQSNTATLGVNVVSDQTTWVGGASGDWNVPSNWSTGVLPGPASNVTIPAGDTVDIAGTVDSDISTLNCVGNIEFTSANGGGGSLGLGNNSTINGLAFDSGSDGTLQAASGTIITFTGSSIWNDGSLAGPGEFFNTGTMLIRSNATQMITAGAKLANHGLIYLGTSGTGTLEISPDNSGAELINRASGEISPSGTETITGGLFINSGAVNQNAGSLTITSELNNLGVLDDETGTLQIAGTLDQYSAGTLTAGTYRVGNSGNLTLPGDVTTNNAIVTLNGANAELDQINTLSDNEGYFNIVGGKTFTTAGRFVDGGTLKVGINSALDVPGNYVQTGTLIDQFQGDPLTGNFGQVNATHKANLSGVLQLQLIPGYSPAIGLDFTIMNFGFATGDFSSVTGTSNWFQEDFGSTMLIIQSQT